MNSNLILSTTEARGKRWRFNPLSNLAPKTLSRHLDAFEAGQLRDAAVVWDALEQRDDLLRTVNSKRKKSVARHGWTVLPVANLKDGEKARAQEHVAALEYFYNHVECEHAVDRAERGGFKLLARQMMDAVGKRFAVHEIIWREATGQRSGAGGIESATNRGVGRLIEATFRFVPLAFFENTTGRLRFLADDFAQEGRELEEGAWMITVGEGLMVASSTAWMFKSLALEDWMRCSQRNGVPALRGISGATRNSAEWVALEQALADLLDGKAVVHSNTDRIEALDLMAGTNIPFPQLVERIDRMLAAMWRGADLSTLSRDRGYGASLQEKETCLLEEDDAEMLTETLNRYVDEWVIRHAFGADEKPLAHVKVLVAPRECTTSDLQVDEFLLRSGAALPIQETMHRYGRALPKAGEAVLQYGTKASLPENPQNPGMAEEMENEGYGCGPLVGFRGCSPSSEAVEANSPPRELTIVPDQIIPEETLSEGTGSSHADRSLANQFTLQQGEWLQLAPYGDFPHARGIQRVDRSAAEGMVAQFKSFCGRLGRLFGGAPFYVGHPDLPGAAETADRKAYGWITEIEARDDGLYGRVKWSEAGMDLLRNAHFKFYSPYWEAREIGSEDGRRVYRPVALLSVGLTNQPNIPVRPLANEDRSEGFGRFRSEDGGGAAGPGKAGEVEEPRQDRSTVGTVDTVDTGAMHTESWTEALALRKAELVRLPNSHRRDRIQEWVRARMRLGQSYDEAWGTVRREKPEWFE